MNALVQKRRDKKRGCGWRKPGGLYLVADGPSAPCGRLPIPLNVCPTCSGGIKPTRSWTWIDGDALLRGTRCAYDPLSCATCPLGRSLGRVGLVWVGGVFYASPSDWTTEAKVQGVSRRIPAVPRDFKVGETMVLVAHREALPESHGAQRAAIFHAFKPSAIEYVVKGNETEEELQALVKRGITPIEIERDESAETAGLFSDAEEDTRGPVCPIHGTPTVDSHGRTNACGLGVCLPVEVAR